MQVIEYKGIVRDVIDTVNNSYAGGNVPTISEILLTDAEMDEFIANNPFTGDIGKFYGDEDVPSIRHVQYSPTKENDVVSFYLFGIKVSRTYK